MINNGVPVVLFDLAADGDDPRANVRRAIDGLRKHKPAPLAVAADAAAIRPATYEQDLAELQSCDLVIEAVAEKLAIKRDLYGRIAEHLPDHALIGSNTSGLSIDAIAEVLPAALRQRFCGVHFFNPPRYMHLLELTPGSATDAAVADRLEGFLTASLGKGVIRAGDTPNFIGNRIGAFSLVATMHHAEAFDIPIETVDALTGSAIGRAKSATFRTADVVGLDILLDVVEGPAERLADDPWREALRLPGWMHQLIDHGALGAKAGAGVFRKEGRAIRVIDPTSGQYRDSDARIDPAVEELLRERDPGLRLAALRNSDAPQARFLWAIHCDLFHYAAHWLGVIADNARDVDLAIRWGFGWQLGPFELWQAAGWADTTAAMEADIAAGRSLATTPLPDWVDTVAGVHRAEGSYAPRDGLYRPSSGHPVYARQLSGPTLVGGPRPDRGVATFETEYVRLWHRSDDPDIGILSFQSAQHAVGAEVLAGVLEVMDIAESRYAAVVLWQEGEPFSVGANLKQVTTALEEGDYARLEAMVENFQLATGRMRDSVLPVVAGLRGMALGGGCEFVMHCDQVVAALESYPGLVEAGVGLIPAGGGCKELARRAAATAPDGDPFPFLRNYFETVATAKVGGSATEGRALGLLPPQTRIIAHSDEVLHVALAEARALAEANYRPPIKQPIRAAGRNGLGTLKASLVNMHAGGFISDHDYTIADYAARALCGGDIETGLAVDEDWLLRLEREGFMALLRTEATAQRVGHMLKTGKPLRN